MIPHFLIYNMSYINNIVSHSNTLFNIEAEQLTKMSSNITSENPVLILSMKNTSVKIN